MKSAIRILHGLGTSTYNPITVFILPFSQVESRSRLQSCVNLRDYSVQLTCEDTVCMRFLPGTHRAKTTPGVHIKFKCFISEKLCQTLHSLPESERAHSCEMVSFHYLTLCSPSQPTLGHREHVHRTLSCTDLETPWAKRHLGDCFTLPQERERSGASICSADGVQPDPSGIMRWSRPFPVFSV